MDYSKEYDRKKEKRMSAPSETFALSIAEDECYLIISSLDLYSRIWIGQYDRIDDLGIYDNGNRWNMGAKSHVLFQRIRDLMIPSLAEYGDYTCCSLGIWSDKTDVKAINAYDIQQRLRYEVSWFRKPEGDISVFFDEPWIRGNIGDFSVFCEQTDGGINAILYLLFKHLTIIQTSLEVYRFLINRNIDTAFKYYTSDEEVLSLAEELTIIYKRYDYLSFPTDRTFGKKKYTDLKNKIALLMEKIRKTRRKTPPDDVLKLPGAGFLTKMIGKEHSTTDYLLVWYEEQSRTEYYFAGEDYVLKHGGRLELPEDIRKYIRTKCNKKGII